MRKAGYSKAKPCGSLRLPTGPWTSHVHFPSAGNQGLEPCKAGFGDRLAPCALPMMWTWRDLNTLPPACKTGALPGELQAHVSEWGILPSRPSDPESDALLSELHSVGWPVRIELTHRRATTSRLSTWLRPQWSWLALPQTPFAYRANALLNELQLQSPPFFDTVGGGNQKTIWLTAISAPLAGRLSVGMVVIETTSSRPQTECLASRLHPVGSGGEDRTPVFRAKAGRPAIERRRSSSRSWI